MIQLFNKTKLRVEVLDAGPGADWVVFFEKTGLPPKEPPTNSAGGIMV